VVKFVVEKKLEEFQGSKTPIIELLLSQIFNALVLEIKLPIYQPSLI